MDNPLAYAKPFSFWEKVLVLIVFRPGENNRKSPIVNRKCYGSCMSGNRAVGNDGVDDHHRHKE